MKPTLGIDWGDLGKNALGVLHLAGSVVLSAFGAGGVAKTLESAEKDVLPDWAGGKPATKAAVAGSGPKPTFSFTPRSDIKVPGIEVATANLARAQARQNPRSIAVSKVDVPKFSEGSWLMDSIVGLDRDFAVLGATKPTTATTVKPAAKKAAVNKGKKVAANFARKGKSPHKEVLKTSASAAARAKDVGTKAVKKASSYNAAKHKALAGLITVLGVVARKLTAKQRAAVTQHTAAITRTRQALTEAQRAGERAVAAGKTLEEARAKAKPLLDKITKLNGLDEILGLESTPDFEVVESPPPDFDLLGEGWETVDEGGGTTPPDYGSGSGSDFDAMMLPPYNRNDDPDIIQPPVRGQPLNLNDLSPSAKPPEDAIWYDYSSNPYNPVPDSIASSNHWASNPVGSAARNPPDGVWFNSGRNVFEVFENGKRGNDAHGGDAEANRISVTRGWGPLVGNPSSKFKGLQMAANGQWFWIPENAPDWVTRDADRQLAALNDKIAAANKATVDAWNKQVMADKLAYQEAQKKADAEAALAQQAANQEADIASARAAAQTEQLDIQARKQLLDWYATHPDVMPTNPDQGGGQGGGYGSEDNIDWGDGSGNNYGAAPDSGIDWGEGDREAAPPPDPSDEGIDWGE